MRKNITVYGVATDDSGVASVKASLDSLNPEDFHAVTVEPIENIMNKSVPIIAPHFRDKTQTIKEFLEENETEIYRSGVMYSFNFSVIKFYVFIVFFDNPF